MDLTGKKIHIKGITASDYGGGWVKYDMEDRVIEVVSISPYGEGVLYVRGVEDSMGVEGEHISEEFLLKCIENDGLQNTKIPIGGE